MHINWPELTTFCGCFSLKTGIYAIGVYHFIVALIICVADILHISEGVKYLDNYSELQNNSTTLYNQQGFSLMLMHLMLWVSIQICLILSIIVLFYAMCKSKPKLIKFYIYVNGPGFVVMTIFNSVELMFDDSWTRFAAVIFTLFYLYQILAVRSFYRKLTGKSTILDAQDITYNENNGDSVSGLDNTTSLQLVYRPTFNHCRTCSCIVPNTPSSQPITTPTSSNAEPETSFVNQTSTTTYGTENVDAKDEPIVYDESQLVRHHQLLEDRVESIPGSSDEGSSGKQNERPTTLDLVTIEEEKRKIEDEPVIYDKNQLNNGLSLVIVKGTRIELNLHNED